MKFLDMLKSRREISEEQTVEKARKETDRVDEQRLRLLRLQAQVIQQANGGKK